MKDRKERVRYKIKKVSKGKRLTVFRSNNHIYAQLIDDDKGVTLASSSSIEKTIKEKKLSRKEVAEIIGKEIMHLFQNNEFDKCILFYNNFKNVITQIPQAQQIIPVKNGTPKIQKEDVLSYEFEPEEDEILNDLLPKNISTQVFKAFLENAASEQGSRMTAMDNATRNAGELVDKLTINYNRSRQASITKELIEIISGAESL